MYLHLMHLNEIYNKESFVLSRCREGNKESVCVKGKKKRSDGGGVGGAFSPCVSTCLGLCVSHKASLHPELIPYVPVTWEQMAAVAMAL